MKSRQTDHRPNGKEADKNHNYGEWCLFDDFEYFLFSFHYCNEKEIGETQQKNQKKDKYEKKSKER